MSTTGVYYTSTQITQMQAAIGQANAAAAAGNSQGVISALNTYYSVQQYNPGTGALMRGYAGLALQVLNNTGSGVIANQQVKSAVGAATWNSTVSNGTSYQTNLALQLATADFNGISTSGGQVPTLSQVATDHYNVFGNLDIPITAWGGTPFTVLGEDFTLGAATSAEVSSTTAPQFSNLSAANFSTSLMNLLGAGESSVGSVGVVNGMAGAATIMGLDLEAVGHYGAAYSPMFFTISENNDGSYQVADASNGLYQNIATNDNLNYSVTTGLSSTSPTQTVITVTDASSNTETIQLAGTAVVQSEYGAFLSGGTATTAIEIGFGASTLQAGSGNDLLIELGNGGTVDGSAGKYTMLIDGTADVVNGDIGSCTVISIGQLNALNVGPGGTVEVSGLDSSATLNGSTVAATVASTGTLTVDGSDNNITAGGTAAIDAIGNSDIINGGVDDIITNAGNNDTDTLSVGGFIEDTTSNSNLTVNGGDESITAAAGDSITISGIGDTTDFLNGGKLVETGSGTSTILQGNSITGNENGASETITATGTLDTINIGTGDTAILQGTQDTVGSSAGGTIDMGSGFNVAYATGGTIIATSTSTNADIFGNGASAYGESGDKITFNGTAELLYGSGLTMTGAANATVTQTGTGDIDNFGTGGALTELTVNATETVTGTSLILTGAAGDTLNLNTAYATDTVDGTSLTIHAAAGDALTLGTANATDIVSGNTVTVTTAAGDALTDSGVGDIINEASRTSAAVSGGNDTIDMNGAADTATLFGGGYTVNGDGSGDTVNLSTSAIATVNGSGGAIGFLVSGDSVTASNETINTIAGDQNENLTGTGDTLNEAANTSVNVSGGSDTINMDGTADYAGLFGGGYTVNGDDGGDTVNLSTGASATVYGSNGSIGFLVSLDSVIASNETINTLANVQNDNVTGTGDTINESTNDILGIWGGFDTINLNESQVVLASGSYTVNSDVGGDTVNLGVSASATVYGSGGAIGFLVSGDSVTAYNEVINTLAGVQGESLTGTGDILNEAANVAFNVAGGFDTVNMDGSGDYVGLLGGSGYSIAGSNGEIATLANTVFTVYGSLNTLYLGASDQVSITGNGEDINAANATVTFAASDTSETVTGSNNTFNFGNDDQASIDGNGNIVNVWQGTVTFEPAATGETVTGSNDIFYLDHDDQLSLNGNAETINAMSATVTFAAAATGEGITGSNNTFNLGHDDQIAINGNDDQVIANGAHTVTAFSAAATSETLSGTAGTLNLQSNDQITVTNSGELTNVFEGENGITIHESNATIKIGSNVPMVDIFGTNDIIYGSGGDGIYINGTQDDVFGNNLYAQYNGINTGDNIYGVDDTGDNYQTIYSGASYDYGLDDTLYSIAYGIDVDDGFAAGALSKQPNLSSIAEFSTPSAISGAASDALAVAGQAIQASETPSAAIALSPYEGMTWSGTTVTWDFANAGADTPVTRAIDPMYQAAIEHAFQIWSSVADIQFQQAASGTSANIHIGFYDLNSTTTGLMGCTLANESGGDLQTSSVIQFDDPSDDPIVLGQDGHLSYLSSGVDLEQLALHEIGHMLGLADNADPDSIMYAELGTSNRTLDQNDITNIQALYGPARLSSTSTNLLVQSAASFAGAPAVPIASASTPSSDFTVNLATNSVH
ncbi:beta strand repeat-containing protein [Rhodopila sp.]|uniref:beta strand repeat-containing protein n=1 Tax=Rhodopila sp. TaxID=2480087 RepID=UPI002C85A0A0|nr:matrixin family metalloprotease [Rhodopila sp.]HVZ08374.1 matrixin family metalloprotease [Rhodopila sp.]